MEGFLQLKITSLLQEKVLPCAVLSFLINDPYLKADIYAFDIYIIYSFFLCGTEGQSHTNGCHLKNRLFTNIFIPWSTET